MHFNDTEKGNLKIYQNEKDSIRYPFFFVAYN